MAEHDEHSSFIKTPKQLITIVLLAFVVPIVGIVLMVQLVINRPHADPAALSAEAVSARLQPVGKVEFAAAGAASGALRSGEEIVKEVCAACHQAGVANAPKLGEVPSFVNDWRARRDSNPRPLASEANTLIR